MQFKAFLQTETLHFMFSINNTDPFCPFRALTINNFSVEEDEGHRGGEGRLDARPSDGSEGG